MCKIGKWEVLFGVVWQPYATLLNNSMKKRITAFAYRVS